MMLCAKLGTGQSVLSFNENWESNSFGTNQWVANGGDGQCSITDYGVNGSKTLNIGHLESRQGNGISFIESPILDATAISKGLITFSFKYKTNNQANSRWEILRAYCDYGNGWELLSDFSFYGAISWHEYRTTLQPALGKLFKVRLECEPYADSSFGGWLLDDIQITSSQTPYFKVEPTVLAPAQGALGIKVDWHTPILSDTSSYAADTIKLYVPLNSNYAIFDTTDIGGSVFNLEGIPNAYLHSIDFKKDYFHLPLNYGPQTFKIHLIDWDQKLWLDTLGPFLALRTENWERNVSLNLKRYPKVKNLGVFLEPLCEYQTVYFPNLVSTYGEKKVYADSYMIDRLPNPYFYYCLRSENFYLDLHILDIATGKEIVMGNTPQEEPSYNLYRWQESLPLNYTIMNANPLSNTSYLDGAVEKGWYSYFVEATYPNQQVLYSDTARAYMHTSAGLYELSSTQVKLYPNPASLELHIAAAQTIIGVELLNSQGRQAASILPGPVKQLSIALSTIAPGLYFARITFNDGSVQSYSFMKE